MHQTKLILPARIPLLGGQLVPVQCHRKILYYAHPIAGQNPQIGPRLVITGIRQRPPQTEGREVLLIHISLTRLRQHRLLRSRVGPGFRVRPADAGIRVRPAGLRERRGVQRCQQHCAQQCRQPAWGCRREWHRGRSASRSIRKGWGSGGRRLCGHHGRPAHANESIEINRGLGGLVDDAVQLAHAL